MNEPVFDDLTIAEHAARVAQSVRAINHLSIGPTADRALPYPCDVATVASDLARAVHGLPQALGQLAARLDRLAASGRVGDADPEPLRVDRAARASFLLAEEAGQPATRLAWVLDAAGSDLSRLAYADPPARSPGAVTDPPSPERTDTYGLEP